MLNRRSALPIHFARAGARLRNGHSYIGKSDAHLALAADSLGGLILTPEDPQRREVPENAIAYGGPIDFIGTSEAIAANIRERVQAR